MILDAAACLAALGQVALVVLFGGPKGLCRRNHGDDGFGREAALGGELLDLGAGLRSLLRGVEEDGGAVLRAPVRTLAVEGGGVMEGKEGVQQLLVADLRGVEVEFDDLGVAGLIGANIPVGGLGQRAALITNGHCPNAGNGREGRFDSPKTAGCKGCLLIAHADRDARWARQASVFCSAGGDGGRKPRKRFFRFVRRVAHPDEKSDGYSLLKMDKGSIEGETARIWSSSLLQANQSEDSLRGVTVFSNRRMSLNGEKDRRSRVFVLSGFER